MNLVKRSEKELWDPFEFWGDFEGKLNRLFQHSLTRKNGWGQMFEPKIDIIEEKDHFLVKADIPGMKKEDFEVKVEGKLLTLKGERKEEKETKEKNYYASERTYGAFARMMELPTEVKADQIKATYKDGVLEIDLPKTESAKTKQVKVEVQ